jgi:glutathione S-transferase
MKVYGFPLSPFVRKVAVAAREKGIDFEWEPSNPAQPSEEFLKASPFGKIPAMADGDFTLADSTAIVTYLDAKYPGPSLIPSEAKAAARAIWFEEVADTVLIPAAVPIVVNRFLRPVIFGTEGNEEEAKAAEEAVKRPLGYLEGELGEDGWLDGDFSVGDIAVASTFKTLTDAHYTLDAAAYPKLAAWYARVEARPAWQWAAEQEAAIFAAASAPAD